MRTARFVALALVAACSSATAPNGTLTGTWNATGLVTVALQFDLAQTGDTILGTALVTPANGPAIELQVRGHSGLAGSDVCFPPNFPIACRVKFSLVGGDAAGDTLYYSGQFIGANSLLGDVQSTQTLPFANIDGEPLRLAR